MVKKKPYIKIVLRVAVLLLCFGLLTKVATGPPANQISLGSAHLTGLQWDGPTLWVGDWFDSNIIRYKKKIHLIKKFRTLETTGLFKMSEGQPMLICNTSEALITIGTDLKIRSHQRVVGLPPVWSAQVPGTRPTGLVWDGEDLWSSDGDTNVIYRHGKDFRVLETVKSIVPNPLGMAYYDNSIWVLGDDPFRLVRLEKVGNGFVWHGPYDARNLLAEGVTPAGMAMGFGRLWLVSGGYPMMVSAPLRELTDEPVGWPRKHKKGGA